jgi:hypothetical protein
LKTVNNRSSIGIVRLNNPINWLVIL